MRYRIGHISGLGRGVNKLSKGSSMLTSDIQGEYGSSSILDSIWWYAYVSRISRPFSLVLGIPSRTDSAKSLNSVSKQSRRHLMEGPEGCAESALSSELMTASGMRGGAEWSNWWMGK